MFLCIKWHTLSCALWPVHTCQTRWHYPNHFAGTHQTRRHLPNRFEWTRQTREPRVRVLVCLRVLAIRFFASTHGSLHKYGVSGHCLYERLRGHSNSMWRFMGEGGYPKWHKISHEGEEGWQKFILKLFIGYFTGIG